MRIEVIDNNAGFSELESPWRTLQCECTAPTIFLTWEWISVWWAAYGDQKTPYVLTVFDDDQLVGVAAFYLTSVRRFKLEFRALRLMGDGSFDSDYLDFLSLSGCEAKVAEAVAAFLQSDGAVNWDLLLLNEVPSGSLHLAALRQVLEGSDFYRDEQNVGCPIITLPASWDDYLKTLKPRMRTKVRSLCRKLEENHQVAFEMCNDSDELLEKLGSLYALHHERWQLRDQQGVFARDAKRRFYRDMSAKFLENGWLRFYSLKVDGAYVAHQFCFEYEGVVSLLQEGFDPQWQEQGVGNVLRAYVLRDCIERKVKTYDFLAGVSRHKTSWGTEINTNIRLFVGRKNLKGRIYFRLLELVRKIRRIMSRPTESVTGVQ